MKQFNKNEIAFIETLEKAKHCVKGELELDNFDSEWFAMDYRTELEGAFPIETKPYDTPLITEEDAKEKDIDIIKCCDACDISYVG